MKLDFLRARTEIQARIARLESELEVLKGELEAFDRVELAINRLNLSMPSDAEPRDLALESEPQQEAEPKVEIIYKSERGHLTKAMLNAVAGSASPLTARQVQDAIIKNGIKPATKNFNVVVIQTLNRLVTKGLLTKDTSGDQVIFRANSASK